jgi:hypothetical protein
MQGGIETSRPGCERPERERDIVFLDLSVLERPRECAMGVGRAREHHEPRRFAIDPVHDPQPLAKLRFEPQVEAVMAPAVARRDHRLAGGFVHRNKAGILVQDFNRRERARHCYYSNVLG